MEIGSEFWSHLTSNSLSRPIWTDWNGDKQLFISGRTALCIIIEDAVREYGCRGRRYLPSYCCHTMIEPFLKADISIEFYPVIVREHKFVAEYNRDIKTDIFYQMDYFGYTQDALLPQTGQLPFTMLLTPYIVMILIYHRQLIYMLAFANGMLCQVLQLHVKIRSI